MGGDARRDRPRVAVLVTSNAKPAAVRPTATLCTRARRGGAVDRAADVSVARFRLGEVPARAGDARACAKVREARALAAGLPYAPERAEMDRFPAARRGSAPLIHGKRSLTELP